MKKIWVLNLVLGIVVILSVCWILFNNAGNLEEEESRLGDGRNTTENQTEQQNEAEVTLYFANNEFVNTGNDSLQKVIPVKKTIRYGSVSLEEAAVRELMKDPE